MQTSEIVLKYFIEEYYKTLNEDNSQLRKFYGDESIICYKIGNQSVIHASGLREISAVFEKPIFTRIVPNLDKGAITHIPSESGDLMILVSGFMTLKDGHEKLFSQFFTLKNRVSSYFILNDMLHFVNPPIIEKATGVISENLTESKPLDDIQKDKSGQVEKSVAVKEVIEKPVAVKEITEKPVAVKEIIEKPVSVKEVIEKPVAVKEITEKPVAVKEVIEKKGENSIKAVKEKESKPQPTRSRYDPTPPSSRTFTARRFNEHQSFPKDKPDPKIREEKPLSELKRISGPSIFVQYHNVRVTRAELMNVFNKIGTVIDMVHIPRKCIAFIQLSSQRDVDRIMEKDGPSAYMIGDDHLIVSRRIAESHFKKPTPKGRTY